MVDREEEIDEEPGVDLVVSEQQVHFVNLRHTTVLIHEDLNHDLYIAL